MAERLERALEVGSSEWWLKQTGAAVDRPVDRPDRPAPPFHST